MSEIKKGILLEDDFKKIVKANPEWIINTNIQNVWDGIELGEMIQVTFEDLGIQKLVTKIEVVDEEFVEKTLNKR